MLVPMCTSRETFEWMDVILSFVLFLKKDTIIGSSFVRGVSGGEKRRVSIGEMLTGSMPVLLMDSISTGLDTCTTNHIMKTLRSIAKGESEGVRIWSYLLVDYFCFVIIYTFDYVCTPLKATAANPFKKR